MVALPYYLVIGPFGMKIWPEMEMVRGATISWTSGAWEWGDEID